MKSFTQSFVEAEDKARRYFERSPFLQAFLAGIGVIIFWRGIWEFLDRLQVGPLTSVVLGSLILMSVGVFVQTFIGNTIIIKKVKQEEQIEKKAVKELERDVDADTVSLAELSAKLDMLISQQPKKK